MDDVFKKDTVIKTAKGDLIVGELRVEMIPRLLKSFLKLQETAEKYNVNLDGDAAAIGATFLAKALQDEESVSCIYNILAEISNSTEEVIRNLSAVNLLLGVKAFFEHNNIAEIKKLFFDLRGMMTDG